MTLRVFLFILLSSSMLPMALPPLCAQMRLVEDDTLFFAFGEQVTVTATRLPTALEHAPAATEVFTARDIARLPVHTVSELIAVTPGGMLRDYGGSGALQLASLRGLGAEYTLVLLNGMRLNGAQNALVDMGQLSLRHVDRVEIARGGFAALYGSNALGGVVNIVTAQHAVPPSLQLGYGGFGWKQAAASAGVQGGAGRAFADVRYEEADNDYDFIPSWGGEELARRNASSLRRAVSAGGDLLLRDATLSLYLDAHDHESGTPGAVFSAAQGRARQRDRALLLSLQLDWAASSTGRLRASLGGRSSRQSYSDPGLVVAGTALDSRYDNRQLSASLAWEQSLAARHRLIVGAEGSFDELESAELRALPQRRGLALFGAGELQLELVGRTLRIFPSLRYETIREAEGAHAYNEATPSMGLHYAVTDALAVRARWSRGFSTPTFNQLYWREGGNPTLRPEYSTAWDGGLVLTSPSLLASAELTFFHHDIRDKIVWTPGEGLYWRPNNIQHVLSTGAEAAAMLRFLRDRLRLRLSAQWMNTRKMNASFPGDATEGKQLIYVPRWSGAAVLGAAITRDFSAAATLRVLGERYYTESNDAALPAHAVLDCAVTLGRDVAGLRGDLRLELRNALDSAYEVVAFYPMPGRHVRATFTTTVM
ncbi:MAG: TonB-dependent receptor [Bacteroidota bacterium]|nr:TonB-dependent receptor [Bacteroidota bacterium]